MHRVWFGVWMSAVASLLLLANCVGHGGFIGSLGAYLTPYATPVQTTFSAKTRPPTSFPPVVANIPFTTRTPAFPRGSRTPLPTRASRAYENDLIDADPTSNVELAQTALRQQGYRFTLLIVSSTSTGLAGEIYRDLTRRNFRATTGPDEGFDTSSYSCHPFCVFVRQEAINEISVASWQNVLRHEYRHMVQAANNPHLAREFRPLQDGLFSTYAAFLEACADHGIFAADGVYHSSERMPQLQQVVGDENASMRQRACIGFPEAYNSLVKSYELKEGEGSFAELFPPFK